MTMVETEIEIDSDVLAWFQAQGDDWQERMNAVLRSFMETHREQPDKNF